MICSPQLADDYLHLVRPYPNKPRTAIIDQAVNPCSREGPRITLALGDVGNYLAQRACYSLQSRFVTHAIRALRSDIKQPYPQHAEFNFGVPNGQLYGALVRLLIR